MTTTVLRVIDLLQPPPNPAPTRWTDRGWSPEQAGMFFSGVESVYSPQSAPLVWWWYTPLQPPPYPAPTHPINRVQSPEQADILFSGYNERVYGPQNAPLLWWCFIAITLECFEGHRPSPTTPKSIYTCLGGCTLAIRRVIAVCESSCGTRARWPLLPAAAMVVFVFSWRAYEIGLLSSELPNAIVIPLYVVGIIFWRIKDAWGRCLNPA